MKGLNEGKEQMEWMQLKNEWINQSMKERRNEWKEEMEWMQLKKEWMEFI